MPVLLAALRFVAIVVLQLIAFFFFYREHGQRAVYHAWYAWMIDALAIISGMTIMGLSAYAIHNPWVFTINIPDGAFWLTFIMGAWQASIHAVKWLIRCLPPKKEPPGKK